MSKHLSITGTTKFVFLIGHPVVQVKTPEPFNAWLAEHGKDTAIVPLDIEPEAVASFFDAMRATRNCVGISVTVPHKQRAFALCDSVSPRARLAGAVNSVRRETDGKLHGDMLDGTAMVSAMARNGTDVRDKDILLVGAGGAGAAIAHAMAEAGCRSIVVLDLERQRQQDLIKALRGGYPGLDVRAEAAADAAIKVAVNASTAGMKETDPLPFPIDRLSQAEIVADAVTRPAITPWLAEASARGLKIQPGFDMALAQLPLQFAFWQIAG